MSNKQRITVFYSWQSDLPDGSNRALIRRQLRIAANTVEDASDNDVIVVIDEATREVSGSPNIPATILGKVASADLFVCDVSTINSGQNGRKTPNPNVIFELGYAVAKLGWERVVLLFNSELGNFPDDLPFDFDRHRASPYKAAEQPSPNQNKKLEGLLEVAIKSLLRNNPEKPNNALSEKEKKKTRDIENIRWAMSTLHLPTLDQHILDSPHMLLEKVCHFYEDFDGVLKNSLFFLYDKSLSSLFEQFHEAFFETVSHVECYHPNANGSAYIFTFNHDLHLSEEKEKIWESINVATNKMHENLQKLLEAIRENYLEISVDDTNKDAWHKYVQFKKEVAETLKHSI